MAHTPGPWKQQITGDHKEIIITGATLLGNIIAAVDSDDADMNESKANARLIAAAPDLLAALNALLELAVWMTGASEFQQDGKAREGFVQMRGAIDLAITAIAKAEPS